MRALSIFVIALSSFGLRAQHLSIHHIDVGQGDATLIQLSNGNTLLIDAGSTSKGNSIVIPFLRKYGIKSLNVLLASHYHADHIGGLDEVIVALSADSVGLVADRGISPHPPQTRAFLEYWSEAEGCRQHVNIKPGEQIFLSEKVSLVCVAVNGTVLGHRPARQRTPDENDLSIAWLLTSTTRTDSGDFSFKYFTGGDCGGGGGGYMDLESSLVPVVGDVDAMKINHHGSRYSSNRAFIEALWPEVVVISVGQGNSYGHPSQDTLDRLQEARSIRLIYLTQRGSGSVVPKLRVAGTISLHVFDTFFTAGADTFRLLRQPVTQRTRTDPSGRHRAN